jgi:outer membrane protein
MRSTLFIIVVLSVFFIHVGPATGLLVAAEEGKVLRLSLKEVQEYAVQHNTMTQNARIDVVMAKKKIWETTTTGLPQITGGVSYQDNLKIPTTLIPAKFLDPDAAEGDFIGVKFGTQHNASLNLTLNQLIFSGSYIVALQASKTYLHISEMGLVKTEIEVKDAVSNTYYLVLLAENTKKTLAANLESVKKTLFETQELFKSGFCEDSDVDQLQLTVTDMENAVKSMNRQITITYNLLKFQMGFDLQQEVRLSQTLDDILAQIDQQQMQNAQSDFTGHINYRLADIQVKAQTLLLKREISEYLPTISAFVSYTQMAMRDKFNFFKKNDDQWFPSTAIGLNISIPIFSSGMRSARVAQAKMELEKAQNTKKQVMDSLQLEMMQAKTNFADTFETAENTRKNIQLAKKIYDKMREKYTLGTVSSLDLTQAHAQYLTAENNYTRAVVELLKAKTRLDKVLNKL